jgi:hypothetical protein
MGRRSADRDRYDADPELIDDDFSRLELRDAENTSGRRSNRPLANPDLFKPTPPPPVGRKVSFQGGPPEEIPDMYSASPPPSVRAASNNKSSKWQPLSAVDPSPVSPIRDEHDPFSLGDSDDERDAKSKEAKSDEAERLQKATSEAMAEDIGTGKSAPDSGPKTWLVNRSANQRSGVIFHDQGTGVMYAWHISRNGHVPWEIVLLKD